MSKDIRWRQRFQNFESAFAVFQRRIEAYRTHPQDEGYQMAVVQAFEIIIELAWKTLKDYLESQGYFEVKNGKQVIRQAFQDGLIQEAEIWMQALEICNETSHTYNPANMRKVIEFVSDRFHPVVSGLYHQLKKAA